MPCRYVLLLLACWGGSLAHVAAQPRRAAADSALVLLAKQQYAAALSQAEQALAGPAPARPDTNYARLLGCLAESTGALGQYDEALRYGRAALEAWTAAAGTGHPQYPAALQQLALAYQNLAAYEQAEPLHREAVRREREAVGEKHPRYAAALNRYGVMYRRMSITVNAEELFLRAKSILEAGEHHRHPEYPAVLSNLADLYLLHSPAFTAKALPLVNAYLRITEASVGTRSPGYAKGLHDLAITYHYTRPITPENLARAEPLYRQTLEIYRSTIGRNNRAYLDCLDGLGTLLRNQGRYAAARDVYQESLDISEKSFGTRHPDYTSSLYWLYVMNLLLNQLDEAERFALRAGKNYVADLHNFSVTLSDAEREQVHASIINHFERFNQFARMRCAANPGILAEQYNNQLAVKAFLLNTSRMVRQRVTGSGDPALLALYDQWRRGREGLTRYWFLPRAAQAQRQASFDSLREKVNALEKTLTAGSRHFAEAVERKEHTWRDVQQALRPGEAAVEIIRYRHYTFGPIAGFTDSVCYAALVVAPGDGHPRLVSFSNGNQLEGPLLQAYRADITGQTRYADSYARYWEPLAQVLRGAKKVYLSPDGVYNQINVASLYNPRTGKYLLEELDVVLVTSTRDLVQPRREGPPRERTAVLVGYPEYGSRPAGYPLTASRERSGPAATTRLRRGNYYDPLPGSREEVRQIARLLRRKMRTQVYTRAAAREETVKQLQSPYVLHIATHGFFETDTALGKTFRSPLLRSGLVLAGANRALQDTASRDVFAENPTEDGILTAYEGTSLLLDGTELVVLSACETGLGEVKNGEGVYGLQRALRVAGARSLLMSLWRVDDRATHHLMTHFYRAWLRTGDKALAFRRAQTRLRKKYPDPYYWAAFVLCGQ